VASVTAPGDWGSCFSASTQGDALARRGALARRVLALCPVRLPGEGKTTAQMGDHGEGDALPDVCSETPGPPTPVALTTRAEKREARDSHRWHLARPCFGACCSL